MWLCEISSEQFREKRHMSPGKHLRQSIFHPSPLLPLDLGEPVFASSLHLVIAFWFLHFLGHIFNKEKKAYLSKYIIGGAPGWFSRLRIQLWLGYDLTAHVFKTHTRLWADSSKSGAGFRFCVFLSLWPSPNPTLSKINIRKQLNKNMLLANNEEETRRKWNKKGRVGIIVGEEEIRKMLKTPWTW